MIISRQQDCPLKSALLVSENVTDYEDFKVPNLSFSLDIEALDAIHLLENWIWEHAEFLPLHDHAVFVTKFDLLSAKNESSTQGMAYVKAMCREGESTSIIEDIGGLTTSAIIAHELAHSLGAYHDGFGESASCSADQNFLMASSASGSEFSANFANNFLLSPCSTKQIENFLNSPESRCLWKKRTKEKPRLFYRSSDALLQKREKKPGELFDRNRQCMIAFGPHYGFCNNREYHHKRGDPCRRLWCKNRKKKRISPCETKSYLPLMDGTKCHDSKWCISGACVHNEFAVFDKRKCEDVNKGYCQKQPASQLELFCRKHSFKDICCATCEHVIQQFKKDLKNLVD
uniref:Peptidase M12B domain-containing protein n=1 Tax=Acrobeloides nanus TaxID=290746 RepID=A0A914D9D6_9BILA